MSSVAGPFSPETAGVVGLSSSQRRLLAKLAGESGSGAAEFPVSTAQRRVWFVEQMSPGGGYAMPIALRLRGALDLAALSRAIQDLVARHEALRTTFPARDGAPVQLVHRTAWYRSRSSTMAPAAASRSRRSGRKPRGPSTSPASP